MDTETPLDLTKACNVRGCPRHGLPNTGGINFLSGGGVQVYYCPFHKAKMAAYRDTNLAYSEWHSKCAAVFRSQWLSHSPEDADVIAADQAAHREWG